MSFQIGQRVRILWVNNPLNGSLVGKETHITHVEENLKWNDEAGHGPGYVLALTRANYFIETQLELVVPDGAKPGNWETLLDIWVPEELADKIKRPQG